MDLTDFVRAGLPGDFQAQLRKAIPGSFFDYPAGLSPDERTETTYERLRHAVLAAPTAEKLLERPPFLCALLERAAVADPALFHVMLLHYTLVLAPILRFGDESTRPVLNRLEAMETFGAVAMTEAGRSNSHLAPGTTARFEPGSRSFILTTPDAAAMKFPTTIGHPRLPKTAVVYAQLIIDDVERGVFIFLVPIRDDTGAVPAGVRVLPAPDGHSLPVDCAAVGFHQYRVPFEAWLASGAQITADGAFHDPSAGSRLAQSMYAAPHVWRSIISAGAAIARASATALLRHSTGRVAMGRLAPGHPLLGYRNQQDAVLTAFARGCVMTAVADHVKRTPLPPRATATSAWAPWAAVDLTLPLLKAFVTTMAEETVALCRVHSGAPGFTASDRLNAYRGLLHGYLSAGGDNELILYDTARAMVARDGYRLPEGGSGSFDLSFEGCLAAARTLERRLQLRLADRVAGRDPFTAWNASLPLAARTATACADRTVLEILQNGPPQLRRLFDWYALEWAHRNAGLLLDEGIAPSPLIDRIDNLRDVLRDDLMPQTADLMAAFDLPELDEPPFWSTPWTCTGNQH